MPFCFGKTGGVRIIFVVLGVVAICCGLLTEYERGLLRIVRIRFHLLLDALFGIAMLAAPMLLTLPTDNGTIVYVIGALFVLFSLACRPGGSPCPRRLWRFFDKITFGVAMNKG